MRASLRVIERPDSEMGWRKVEKFLETTISESLKNKDGFSITEKLDAKRIEELILERAPFLCIDKAVILDKGGVKTIVTTSVVTKDMCDGHFPNRLMIPLLIFSKIIALTGEILVSWVKQPSKIVPLAMRASEVRTSSRDLVTPPTLVVTEAEFLSEKMGYAWVSAKSWVGNENVAMINKLSYFLISQEMFFAGANPEI